MKPKSINDPYHNPFHNRFHVPVHSRMDEMQAFTQMIWLNERTPAAKAASHKKTPKTLMLRTTVFSLLGFFVAYLVFRVFAA